MPSISLSVIEWYDYGRHASRQWPTAWRKPDYPGLTGLLKFVIQVPDELLFGRILPALGLMLL